MDDGCPFTGRAHCEGRQGGVALLLRREPDRPVEKANSLDGFLLRSVVMMLRDVPKTLSFFQSALQLPVISAAPHQAMLQAGTSTLVLVQAKDEASCTTGYSPFLTFAVRDFDDTVV